MIPPDLIEIYNITQQLSDTSFFLLFIIITRNRDLLEIGRYKKF